jgi:hypothetical protein
MNGNIRKNIATIFILALFFAQGCAGHTSDQVLAAAVYTNIMQKYVGRHVDDFVRNNGPYQKSENQPNGGRVLTWERERTLKLESQKKVSCTTELFIDKNGVITKWQSSGNRCLAWESGDGPGEDRMPDDAWDYFL